MRIRLSGKAKADLLDAYDYLVERSPASAERLLRQIDNKLDQLSRFPLIGRLRPEFAPNLHSVVIRDYIIFYSIADAGMTIVRIIDGRMDLERAFGPSMIDED